MPKLPALIWVFAAASMLLLLAMIVVPVRFITRRPRIERLRAAPGRRVLSWWLAAVAPWAVAIAFVEWQKSFHISVSSLWGLALGVLIVLCLFVVLVVLPVLVITGSGIWAFGRWKRERREE